MKWPNALATVPSTWPGSSAKVASQLSSAAGAGSPPSQRSSAIGKKSKSDPFRVDARLQKRKRCCGSHFRTVWHQPLRARCTNWHQKSWNLAREAVGRNGVLDDAGDIP
jgi:hypothetical protein